MPLGMASVEEREARRYISRRTRGSLNSLSHVQRLRHIVFFKECSDAFLQALVYHLKEEVFQPREIMIREGDIGNCMYLLNIGLVDITVCGKQVASLKDGAVFGEIAVLSSDICDAKRTASITARTVCLCWCIDRPALLQVMAVFAKDRALILAHADERLKTIRSQSGHMPPVTDRLWLRQQFQPKISPKARQVVALAKLKFLKAIKKPKEVPEEEGEEAEESAETDVQSARSNRSEVPQELEEEGLSSRSLSVRSVPERSTHGKSRHKFMSEPPGMECHMQGEEERNGRSRHKFMSEPPGTECQMQGEERPNTTRSEPPYATSQMEYMLDVIYRKQEALNVRTSLSNGVALPPVLPPVKRRSSWSFRETAEVSKARTSALDFLAKRGALE